MNDLIDIFTQIFAISLVSFSGSAQAVFYDMGVVQTKWIAPHDYANYLGFGFATPGPQVFSLATFIGFGVSGWTGALTATLAIYMAPTVLAIAVIRYLRRWIEKDIMNSFVQAVGIAAAGILVAIALELIGTQHISVMYFAVVALSALAVNKKINPLFIIVAGLFSSLFIR